MNKEKELDINYAEIIDIDINSLDEYEKTEQFEYDRALDLLNFYLEQNRIISYPRLYKILDLLLEEYTKQSDACEKLDQLVLNFIKEKTLNQIENLEQEEILEKINNIEE